MKLIQNILTWKYLVLIYFTEKMHILATRQEKSIQAQKRIPKASNQPPQLSEPFQPSYHASAKQECAQSNGPQLLPCSQTSCAHELPLCMSVFHAHVILPPTSSLARITGRHMALTLETQQPIPPHGACVFPVLFSRCLVQVQHVN